MTNATRAVKSLCAIACIVFTLSGCATPSQAPTINVSKEQTRLRKAMAGRKAIVAVNCVGYDIHMERVEYNCPDIYELRPLQQSVATWANVVENGGTVQPGDLQIRATWTVRDIYTDGSGATAAAAMFSLGVVPSIEKMELKLDVRVIKDNKTVFTQRFVRVDEGNNNLWTRKADTQALVKRIATRIVDDFTRELEGSEAVEQ